MKNKILYVEDDDLAYKIVSMRLGKSGIIPPYELIQVKNGDEALAAYDRGGIALVLMDIALPGDSYGGGIGITRELRRRDQDLPIVGLSAIVAGGAQEDFMEAGGTHYLKKPCPGELLTRTITQYLPELQ